MLTQRDSHPLRLGSDNAPAFAFLGFPEPRGKGLVETSHLGLSVSWSLILWVWVSVPTCCSLIFVTLPGLFCICLFVLSHSNMIFVLSYILFCCILLLFLRSPFFPNEKQRKSESRWEGSWGKFRRSTGRENHTQGTDVRK